MQAACDNPDEFILELDVRDCADLPTTKEHFEIIDGRLDRIETALGLQPKSKKAWLWLVQRWEWATKNKGTSLILGVILCAAGIFGGGITNTISTVRTISGTTP